MEAEPAEPHHRNELGFSDGSVASPASQAFSSSPSTIVVLLRGRVSEPKGVNMSLPVSQLGNLRFRALMELT